MTQEIVEKKSGPKTVGAAKLTVEILRELARRKGPVGVTLLAKDIGRYPGTVYSVLKTLQSEGLVNFNLTSKTYSLCYAGLLEISGQQQPDNLLIRIDPEMKIAANDLGTCVYLSQHLRPGSMLVVARATPDQPVGTFTRVGTRFTTRIGGAGRLHAGWKGIDEKHLLKAYNNTIWVRGKPDFDDWAAQVIKDRNNGWAYEENSLPEGLASVSVHLGDEGKPIQYMFNTIGPLGHFKGDQLQAHIDTLKSLVKFASMHR
jgi:DNA-binding IclR family transcriptional regulator